MQWLGCVCFVVSVGHRGACKCSTLPRTARQSAQPARSALASSAPPRPTPAARAAARSIGRTDGTASHTRAVRSCKSGIGQQRKLQLTSQDTRTVLLGRPNLAFHGTHCIAHAARALGTPGFKLFFVVRTQGLQYAACHGERSSVDQRNTKTAQYMTRSPWHIRFATDQTIRKCLFACRHLGMNDNLKPASLRKMRVPRTYRSPIMVFQPARKQQLLLPQAKKHFRNLLPTQGARR
jgi:hypothetical protein